MPTILLLLSILGGGPAETARLLRSYDIGFLTEEVPQFPAARRPAAPNLALDDEPAVREEGAVAFEISAGESLAAAGLRLSPETLKQLITRNIAEDTWANERNSIEVLGDELVVVQVPEVHEAIAAMLAALRARRARMVTVEVALVPPEALRGYAFEQAPWIADADFDAALERAGERGARISLTAYNEQRVSGFSGRRRATVTDTEVNQTGVIPVSNPVVNILPIGVSLEVHALAIDGSDRLRLHLRVARLEEAAPPVKRETFFSEVEFLPLREESLEAVLILSPGRGALAGAFADESEPDGRREFAVIARARPTDLRGEAAPPEPPPGSFHLRAYDIAFLRAPAPDQPELLDENEIIDLIRSNMDPEAWLDQRASLEVDAGRLLLATARAGTHRAIRAWIDGMLRERGRIAIVEVSEFAGPLDALLRLQRGAEGGWILPGGWREGEDGRALRLAFHAVAAGLLGSRAAARGIAARSYVSDVETASGGTGFSVISMPDPVVASAGTGFSLAATVRALNTPGLLALDLDLERCRTEFARTGNIIAPMDVGPSAGAPGGTLPGSPAPAGPAQARFEVPYVIDLPDQTASGCRLAAALPAGRPALLQIREAPGGEGRMVVARARIAPAFEEGR